MMEDKGLKSSAADAIGEYVNQRGAGDLLNTLKTDSILMSNTSAKKGVEEMELLLDYLDVFDVRDKISFDLSLARGLDYYTGVIFEVVTEGSAPSQGAIPDKGSSSSNSSSKKRRSAKASASSEDLNHPISAAAEVDDDDDDRSSDPSVGVGSIAAGGRYDDLVGMFSGKGQIPCVGISFGIDRIFSLIKSSMENSASSTNTNPTGIVVPAIRSTEIVAFVMAFGGKGFTGMLRERIQLAKLLWENGIPASFLHKVKPKLPAQFKAAESDDVPFAVILGEDEQARGMVRLKQLGLPAGHPEKDGVLVLATDLIREVRARMALLGDGEVHPPLLQPRQRAEGQQQQLSLPLDKSVSEGDPLVNETKGLAKIEE